MSDSSEKISERPTLNCFNIRTVKVRTSRPTVRHNPGQIIPSWENKEFRSYIIYIILQGPYQGQVDKDLSGLADEILKIWV